MFVNNTHVLTILCVYKCVTRNLWKSLAAAHKMNTYRLFICIEPFIFLDVVEHLLLMFLFVSSNSEPTDSPHRHAKETPLFSLSAWRGGSRRRLPREPIRLRRN